MTVESRAADPLPGPASTLLSSLVSHIVSEHHAYARHAIERLTPLAREVAQRHGQGHPELARVVDLVEAIAADLLPHMRAEENVLFPAIVRLADPACENATRGMLRAFLHIAHHDHHEIGELLAMLRRVTNDYVAPEAADSSMRALFVDLAAFETNLQEHLRLEDRVLLPAARTLGPK